MPPFSLNRYLDCPSREVVMNKAVTSMKDFITFILKKYPGILPGHSHKNYSKSNYSGMVASGGLLVSLPEYPRFWLI